MEKISGHILIGDGNNAFRDDLCIFFKNNGWIVSTAADGREAARNVRLKNPDIVLLDIDMPVLDGIKACNIIKNNVTFSTSIPIIMMANFSDKKTIVAAIKAGCDDFILKPFSNKDLIKKVEDLHIFFTKKKKKEINVEVEKEKSTFKIPEKKETEPAIIIAAKDVTRNFFASIMENKPVEHKAINAVVNDMLSIVKENSKLPLSYKIKSYQDYTYVHSVNVSSLSVAFAHHLKWSENDLQIIGEGALLHDIGKVKVGLSILMKPGKLTEDEFLEMKKHPIYSMKILALQGASEGVQSIALEHHEKMNGTGYPNGINHTKISKYGKLVAIVDVYDAMTTDKCYQSAVDSDKALSEMHAMEGHFDPELLKIFTKLISSGIIGK